MYFTVELEDILTLNALFTHKSSSILLTDIYCTSLLGWQTSLHTKVFMTSRQQKQNNVLCENTEATDILLLQNGGSRHVDSKHGSLNMKDHSKL